MSSGLCTFFDFSTVASPWIDGKCSTGIAIACEVEDFIDRCRSDVRIDGRCSAPVIVVVLMLEDRDC